MLYPDLAPAIDQPVITYHKIPTYSGAPTIPSSAGWYREKRLNNPEVLQSVTPNDGPTVGNGKLDVAGSTYFGYPGMPPEETEFHSGNPDQFIKSLMKPGGAAQYAKWLLNVATTTTASQIEFRLRQFQDNPRVGLIVVNGRRINLHGTVATGITGAGTTYTAKLTFPDSRPRNIVIYHLGSSEGFGGAACTPGHTITAYDPGSNGIGFIGDSYTNGASNINGDTSAIDTYVWDVACELGGDFVVQAGIGGSGWETTATVGEPQGAYSGRTLAVLELGIQILVWLGGRNDPVNVTTAVNNALTSGDAAGVENQFVVSDAPNGSARTAEIQAAAGDRYIPVDIDALPKLGAGDNTHPTYAGHQELAATIVAFIKGALNPGVPEGTLFATAENVQVAFEAFALAAKATYARLGSQQTVSLLTPPDSLPYTVNLASKGAIGDGTANDFAAVQAAVDDVTAAGGGVILVPNKAHLVRTGGGSGSWIQLPANVTIRGEGALSELTLASTDTTSYRELFRVIGDNVHFESVKLAMQGGVYGCMIDIRASANTWFYQVEIDGQMAVGDNTDFNAIRLYGDLPDVISGLRVVGCEVHHLAYGVVQDSIRTVTVSDQIYQGCNFHHNRATDLELNAPDSLMDGVDIIDCSFADNRSEGPSAGWGVGLANVQNTLVERCSFARYKMNPVHIEDNSSQLIIRDCTFEDVSTIATGYAAAVIFLSGTNNVTASGNTFNVAGNLNALDVFYIGPGGTIYPNPYDITITDNKLRMNATSRLLGNYGSSGVIDTAGNYFYG